MGYDDAPMSSSRNTVNTTDLKDILNKKEEEMTVPLMPASSHEEGGGVGGVSPYVDKRSFISSIS